MLAQIVRQTERLPATDWTLAILFASLLALGVILLRRFRSRRALMQRVAELEALSDAGLALLGSQLDVAALGAFIAETAGRVIDTSTFQVGLFEGNIYRILYWTVDGEKREPVRFELSENEGLIGWVRRTQQPLLVRDFAREMDRLPARPSYVSDNPPRSAVFVPLISGNESLGVIVAQSARPVRFDEEDLRRLMIVANQAAAAIANERLYANAASRATQLALVLKIVQEVSAVQELDQVLSQVVERIHGTFGFHPVSIFGLDRDRRLLIWQAGTTARTRTGPARIPLGQGLIGAAAASGETTYADDTRQDERFLARIDDDELDASGAGTTSEIAIPLAVAGHVIGVLDVHSADIGAFGEAERAVLEALAAAVSVAIQQASQIAGQQRQAWLTTVQLQAAETLRDRRTPEEVAQAAARLLALFSGAETSGVLFWERDQALYTPAAIFGASAAQAAEFHNQMVAIGDWPALDAAHVGWSPRITGQAPPWASANGRGAPAAVTALAPLLAGDQLLGMVVAAGIAAPAAESLVWTPPHQQNLSELINSLTDQIAEALNSALLRQAQQEEAWVNTALLQVAEAVNNLLAIDEILSTIARLVPLLVGVRACLILIWDDEEQAYRTGPQFGLDPRAREVMANLSLRRDDFLTLAKIEPQSLTPTTTYYLLELPPWLRDALGTPSALALPLIARGRLVGALIVGPTGDGRLLSGRRLNLLTGVAHQAAVAVLNDQLYRQAAEQERMEQELAVAREIQRSLIPGHDPTIPGLSVAAHWEAARQVGGDFYDFLDFPDEQWGVVIADVADKGVPAALFMAFCRTVVRTMAFQRRAPADTLYVANYIIYHDTQSDLFVTVFYAVWDPATHTLSYASGGHNPPLHFRADGTTALLPPTGMALGVLPDIAIGGGQVTLAPGETVVLYTDGVTEAMDANYVEFGLEALQSAVRGAMDEGPPAVVEAVTKAITAHIGRTPSSDDVTLVVLRRQ